MRRLDESGAAPAPGLVADTQVVLDWLVFRDAAAQPLLDALLQRRLRWLATPAMRAELGRMLRHASLTRWGHDVEQSLTFIDRYSIPVADAGTAASLPLHCSDPDDQLFIDAALVHGARWLVTRDRALLKLRRRAERRGLRILRPGDWHDDAAGG